MLIEATVNQFHQARLVFDPDSVNPQVVYDLDSTQGEGAGDPVSLHLFQQIGITEPGAFSVEVLSESAGDWDILSARFTVSKIINNS